MSRATYISPFYTKHFLRLHQTFSEILPTGYWIITSLYPDLFPKQNTQLRLMVNFGLQSELPWLRKENIDKCLFCNLESKDWYHFVLWCPYFRNGWSHLWMLLKNILIHSNAGFGK